MENNMNLQESIRDDLNKITEAEDLNVNKMKKTLSNLLDEIDYVSTEADRAMTWMKKNKWNERATRGPDDRSGRSGYDDDSPLDPASHKYELYKSMEEIYEDLYALVNSTFERK